MNYEQARFNMIEQQIRPWEVLDNQVLSLLAVVKREDFVPPAHAALAFVDMEIPLGSPHTQQQNPGQCMLAPKVEAARASTGSMPVMYDRINRNANGKPEITSEINTPQ